MLNEKETLLCKLLTKARWAALSLLHTQKHASTSWENTESSEPNSQSHALVPISFWETDAMSVLTTILARWPAAILWCQGSFPWAHGGESESESEVAQSWQTLCDPMDCTLQDSSVHGIFQAGVLEWVAISFSRGSSQPRDRTQVSCIPGRCFTIWEWECDDQFEDLHHFVEEGSPRCWLAAKLSQWHGSQCGEQRGAVSMRNRDQPLACLRLVLQSFEPLGSSFDGQQSPVDTHLNSPEPGGIQVPTRTPESAHVFNKKNVWGQGFRNPQEQKMTTPPPPTFLCVYPGSLLQLPGRGREEGAEALQQPEEAWKPGPWQCEALPGHHDGSHLWTGERMVWGVPRRSLRHPFPDSFIQHLFSWEPIW